MIQVFKPYYGEEEIEAVAEVIRSGWVGLGPKTALFEKEFAEFCRVKYCIGFNSCTAALDTALKLLGVNHGDEVIVPTITFVSTAHSVAYNLATPIFADVDEGTLNIDIEDVARKISPRTKAIIPVHYSGRPVDMDKLSAAAGGIPIIEDAAHASGASYKGQPVGGLGDIGCFSFHAVKNLAMGEGGAITLNNREMAERAKRLRWLGIDKGTWDRTEVDTSYWWEYSVDEIGLKSHLSDIAAAIGLAQLKKLEEANLKRRRIVEMYREKLERTSQIEMPPEDNEDFRSSWHLCEIKAEKRDELSVYLRDRNINTGVHYKPIHLYRCYGNKPHLPVAEKIFSKILTLPLYPDLTDEEVEYITRTITKFYAAKKPTVASNFHHESGMDDSPRQALTTRGRE
ncbi:MAG: DegT/DnrJ/EryC1/StrS family aminotransferase [Deltaproteobacteria bacterium]|nr:DegT/DnrJ/EryC1/StrS family aminotransferase [Deltaproteobacteria bacterium]